MLRLAAVIAFSLFSAVLTQAEDEVQVKSLPLVLTCTLQRLMVYTVQARSCVHYRMP